MVTSQCGRDDRHGRRDRHARAGRRRRRLGAGRRARPLDAAATTRAPRSSPSACSRRCSACAPASASTRPRRSCPRCSPALSRSRDETMAAQCRGKGVGARLPRKEDDRFLRGRGEFVGRHPMVGMLDVAFVRHPVAHARIRAIRKPAGPEDARVRASAISPACSRSSRSRACRASSPPRSPCWRTARCAMSARWSRCACADPRRSRGPRRAVEVEYDELPAVVDMLTRARPARRWCTSTGATTSSWRRFVDDDLSAIRRSARRSRCGAACAPRASACRRWKGAAWLRLGPAAGAAAGVQRDPDAAHRRARPRRMPRARPGRDPRRGARRRRRLRLQGHPAAGGSLPRLAGAAARPSGALDRGSPRAAHRQRQLPRARLRHHRAMPTRDGTAARHRLRGDGRFRRVFRPIRSPPAWRPRRSARILPGPYTMERYRCRTWSVATNKPPILPYRGVARTGVCFALEADARRGRARGRAGAARGAARATWCRRTAMPFDNITSKHFDSGDYPRMPAPRRGGDRPARGARAAGSAASRTGGASASAWRSSASRPRTAPRSMPAGASRWCPGTSRRSRA